MQFQSEISESVIAYRSNIRDSEVRRAVQQYIEFSRLLAGPDIDDAKVKSSAKLLLAYLEDIRKCAKRSDFEAYVSSRDKEAVAASDAEVAKDGVIKEQEAREARAAFDEECEAEDSVAKCETLLDKICQQRTAAEMREEREAKRRRLEEMAAEEKATCERLEAVLTHMKEVKEASAELQAALAAFAEGDVDKR